MTDIQTNLETPTEKVRSRSLDAGTIAAGVISVVMGGLWLLDVLDIVQIRAAILIPSLLAGVGLALMAASFRGSHPGLVTLGVFLTVATFFSAVAPVEALRGGLGERTHVVQRVGDLRSQYEVGLGTLDLDLSQLRLEEQRSVTVAAAAGELRIKVPAELPMSIEAHVGAGDVFVFDRHQNGVSIEQSYESPTFDTAQARLELDLEVGAGRIEVTR